MDGERFGGKGKLSERVRMSGGYRGGGDSAEGRGKWHQRRACAQGRPTCLETKEMGRARLRSCVDFFQLFASLQNTTSKLTNEPKRRTTFES